MLDQTFDVVVIGGGPAGLAVAVSARDNGAQRVLIIERDRELGGILQQCVHNGFGLHRFRQELTGPGYAGRYIRMLAERPDIAVLLDTMVLSVAGDKTILAVNPCDGLLKIVAGAVVFAMGCRERTRGAIRIPGSRSAGVFTAGAAQRMVNMDGYLPGKNIVILGSGDIGLIMARRLSLEGCGIKAVLEIMPYSNGLTRNVVQCLEDFGIPLYLSHTVVAVHGQDRVTGITCARVDDRLRPLVGTEFDLACDCLLLSVGLIPENELSGDLGIEMDSLTGGPVVDQLRQTNLPGFFAAGNVVHVHDLVDFVSEEGETAGKYAASYAAGRVGRSGRLARVAAACGVRTVVPQVVRLESGLTAPVRLYMRVSKPECRVALQLTSDGKLLLERQLPVAKPGEMVVADIPADKLRDIGDVITVALQRQGGEQHE